MQSIQMGDESCPHLFGLSCSLLNNPRQLRRQGMARMAEKGVTSNLPEFG